MEQLVRIISVLMQHWMECEVISKPGRDITHVLEVLLTSVKYLCVDWKKNASAMREKPFQTATDPG